MGNKIIVIIIFVFISLFLLGLIIYGYLSPEPLVGLLGVATGAFISEFSHRQYARDERRHKLRMAALDKRLQAHQEAFSLWRKILADMGDSSKIGETVDRCQEWWDNNCLYLTSEARQAFVRAYLSANTRHVTLMSRDIEAVRTEFEIIKRAGDLIVQGVELPIIAEGEEKPFNPDDTKM